jgi:hypothetical protein
MLGDWTCRTEIVRLELNFETVPLKALRLIYILLMLA